MNIENTHVDEEKLQHPKCLVECWLCVQHGITPSPTLSYVSLQADSQRKPLLRSLFCLHFEAAHEVGSWFQM